MAATGQRRGIRLLTYHRQGEVDGCEIASEKAPPSAAFMDPPPDKKRLKEAADRAHYVGSPEHKRHPSFAGPPAPRATATLCDARFADQQALLTGWIKSAIRMGQVSAIWNGDFPRNVWFENEGVVYEGRLVNQSEGGYKGWQLEKSQYPKELA